MSKIFALDPADCALLAAAQNNARATLGELAEHVHLSVSATRSRLQSLQARGVITGFHAHVDPAVVGYALRAVVRMKVHGSLYDKVTAFVAGEPQVVRCLRLTGETCYLLEVVAVDMRDLARITSGLATIGSLTTDLVYEVVTNAPIVPPHTRDREDVPPTW